MSRKNFKNPYNDIILDRLFKRMSISGQEVTLDELQNLINAGLKEVFKITKNPKGVKTKELVRALDGGLQVMGFVDRALAWPKNSIPLKIKIGPEQAGFGRISDDEDEDSSEESEDSNDCRDDGCNCSTSCCIHCMRNLITKEQAKFCRRIVISDGEIKFTDCVPGVEVQQHQMPWLEAKIGPFMATKQKEVKISTKAVFAKRK